MTDRITAQALHYNDCASVTPERSRPLFRKAFQAGRVQVRGEFDRAALTRGAATASLGEYPLHLMPAPTSGLDSTEYFIHALVIKSPGRDTHKLPNELGYLDALVQQVANHEFAIDPNAVNKICFMTLRSLVLKEGVSQIAENTWHANKVPTVVNTLPLMLPLDISPDSLSWAAQADPQGVISEYIVSDISPTLVQTAPATEPMEVVESDTAYHVTAPGFAYRQVEPYEIIHGNSYTYHAAATPAPEDIGHRRTFIRLTYAPTI